MVLVDTQAGDGSVLFCDLLLRDANFEHRIFIIEGILTVLVGFAARFWVCDWPETAKFLTEEERLLLITRLQTDSGEAVMNRLDKAASMCLPSYPLL